jgi:hypothetical protein
LILLKKFKINVIEGKEGKMRRGEKVGGRGERVREKEEEERGRVGGLPLCSGSVA